jgi:YD repeat-containing protein
VYQHSKAYKRQGWDESQPPLYGDIERVVMSGNEVIVIEGHDMIKGVGGPEYEYVFNQRGDVVHKITRDMYFEVKKEEFFSYDADGRMLESTISHANGKQITVRYKYDSNGLLIGMTESNNLDSQKINGTYSYDRSGNMTELVKRRADGSLCGRITYSYDSRGNKIQETSYNENNYIDQRANYSYDRDGNKIEIEVILNKRDGILGERKVVKYEPKGGMAKIMLYNRHNKLIKEQTIKKWKYDNNGNAVEAYIYEKMPYGVVEPVEITEYKIEYR